MSISTCVFPLVFAVAVVIAILLGHLASNACKERRRRVATFVGTSVSIVFLFTGLVIYNIRIKPCGKDTAELIKGTVAEPILILATTPCNCGD